MKILSINTANNICSVSISNDLDIIYEDKSESSLTHSENLMPMLKKALDINSLNLKAIDLFCCNIGPGSFTGIRIGISTIKAFVDVLDKPCIGISSLEGLAYSINSPGIICSLIDAKNDNLYYGIFELKDNIYYSLGDYFCDSTENIIAKIKQSNYSNITFIGDGAITYKNLLLTNFKNSTILPDNLSASSISKVAFKKYNNSSNKKIYSLSPLYLRKSQAERFLEEGKNK